MILAFPVATPEVQKPILGCMGDTREVCLRLRDLGYEGVEFFTRDASAFDGDAVEAAIQETGMRVVAVGTGPVAVEDGLTFTDADPARRRTAIAHAQKIVDFAARFGAQVNVGKLRGMLGKDTTTTTAWRDEGFRELCAYAAERQQIITLEPQGRTIIDNLNTTDASLTWLKGLNLPNLRMMLDTFHLEAEEASPIASLVKARDVLLHIHLSDINRWPPGQGSIDFLQTLRVLRALNYNGGLTVEIRQEPDSFSAARTAARYLHALRELIA